MRTVFTPAFRHWIVVAAASAPLVVLTACDRNTADDLPPRSDSVERPNDPNRSPVTPATPTTPLDPPVQMVPPAQPEAPAAPGTGGAAPGGTPSGTTGGGTGAQ